MKKSSSYIFFLLLIFQIMLFLINASRAFANPAAEPKQKNLIDLQSFKQNMTIEFKNSQENKGKATLINLNPAINIWYTLHIEWPNSKENNIYHLENVDPKKQKLTLDPNFPDGVIIENRFFDQKILSSKDSCDLWSKSGLNIRMARYSKKPYASLCDGRILLRNKIEGNLTAKERVTDFLRSHVWKGEQITSLVKETIFKDHFQISTKVVAAAEPIKKIADANAESSSENPSESEPIGPKKGLISPKHVNDLLVPKFFGLKINFEEKDTMQVGKWYELPDNQGIYVTAIQPSLISEEVMSSNKRSVGSLDQIEMESMAYLVAYDLDQFDLDFAMGTDNPEVGWSDRVDEKLKDPTLSGPDGVDTFEPIVPLGFISPEEAERVVSTFTGGFKRTHGAFKWGELSRKNRGSHYGFIENGTVFSTLQPDLATLIIYDNGLVQMKTWHEEDNSVLEKIKHARQNGVALIDYDEKRSMSVPGKYVNQWGPGNWSGSQDSKFRTLRAGVCMQYNKEKAYLIYGYFSCATPSAMTRVFQAYDCQYAFHLDMNALEHTYLAVYTKKQNDFKIQHIITDMKILDKVFEGRDVPRFVGFPDNRDFFYFTRR